MSQRFSWFDAKATHAYLQMDAKASAAHNYLEHMLLDETVKPTMLPLSLLEAITNNFSRDREIGRGGFAVVYKGMLGNDMVAVKKLSQTLDEKKFIQEVQCLMKARHKNIVRFLGYCADTQGEMTDYEGKYILADVRNRLLCFEFVPNGSLSELINDASCGLEWRVRYQIIKGICEGLHYLHKNRIVHLDLKPGNILLDGNMVPKIADFGLSRCFDENQSKAITSKLIGTVGYVAPEFYDGQITFKLDMYSLGVIVMEMLTGKKGYSRVDKVLESWRDRLEIPHQDTHLYQVRLCFDIGLRCIDPNPENRPVTQYVMDKLRELESSYDFIDDFHSVNNDTFSLNGLEKNSHQNKEDAVANKEPIVVKEFHPDVCKDPKNADLIMRRVIEAYQTVVLKVAIHCPGCKKKVRKVLRSIEGVQSVTVDASQHKVTVVGTVDADTLIQMLYKSGKKGEQWQWHRTAQGNGGKDAAAAAGTADKKLEEAVKAKELAAPQPSGGHRVLSSGIQN